MKEIDWTKPIETEWGDDAFVNKVFGSGEALVTYWDNDEQRHLSEVMDVCDRRVRNKPELIKPEGWVRIQECEGSIWFENVYDTKVEAEKGPIFGGDKIKAIASVKELMSGKFKDGIPKGYGLGGEDD